MDKSLAQEVRERAGHACEYCRMPQSCYPTVPFPIDHIVARQHGGSTTRDNLAVSCLHDNTHKGPNIAGIDPLTGASPASSTLEGTVGMAISPGMAHC